MQNNILPKESNKADQPGGQIEQVRRAQRCLWRAIGFMLLLTALAAVGLGYSAVLLADYPHQLDKFFADSFVRFCCVVGLGSLICLSGMLGLGAHFRSKLQLIREHFTGTVQTDPGFGHHPAERTMWLKMVHEEIAQVHRDQCCVHRWVCLMGLLTVLAGVGVACSARFLPQGAWEPGQLFADAYFRVCLIMGSAAVMCLAAFLALGAVYRKKMDRRRECAHALRTEGAVISHQQVREVMTWPTIRNMPVQQFQPLYEYLRAIPHSDPENP